MLKLTMTYTFLILFMLTGCGGGGGGGTSFDDQFNAATLAPVTVANGAASSEVVLEQSASSGPIDALGLAPALNGNDQVRIPHTELPGLIFNVYDGGISLAPSLTPYSASATVGCDSGSITVSVSGDDTNAYPDVMTAQFNSCIISSVTMNGGMSISLYGDSINITQITARFTSDFTISGFGESVIYYNGSNFTMDNITTYTYRVTETLKCNINGNIQGVKNLIYTFDASNDPGFTISFVSGSIYINSIANYVYINTGKIQTPFVVDTSGNLTAGVLYLKGAGGGNIKLEVTATNTITVSIDADNDGTYETSQDISV